MERKRHRMRTRYRRSPPPPPPPPLWFTSSHPMAASLLLRARLLPAARQLEAAIHSDIVAHTLVLYHFVRLQRALSVELGVGVKAAARRLNGWLSEAYAAPTADGDANGSEEPECVRRINHDACRVYTILNDGDDGDGAGEAAQWWPQLLQSLCASGRRPIHALAVLRMLNRHHGAIRTSYPPATARQKLYSYYLRTKHWSAPLVEQDLQNDGVIDAEEPQQGPEAEMEPAEEAKQQEEEEQEQEVHSTHAGWNSSLCRCGA